jgi:hypothetical protein
MPVKPWDGGDLYEIFVNGRFAIRFNYFCRAVSISCVRRRK